MCAGGVRGSDRGSRVCLSVDDVSLYLADGSCADFVDLVRLLWHYLDYFNVTVGRNPKIVDFVTKITPGYKTGGLFISGKLFL